MVPVRLFGYTRMSTASQDVQLELDATGVQNRDVFADFTSGIKTALERPGMKKFREYAEPGDTVVVWRVARLGRSLIDVLITVSLLRERGVQLRSISDGIDPATSSGLLMLNMLASPRRVRAGVDRRTRRRRHRRQDRREPASDGHCRTRW